MERRRVVLFSILTTAVVTAVLRYLWFAHATMYIDEQVYARLGYSLSQGHLASASSFFQLYKQYGLNRSDIYTPYGYLDSVQPWLDHPPLVGLLLVPVLEAGLLPRALPIAISMVISILLFLFLRAKNEALAVSCFAVFTLFTFYTPLLSMLFLDAAVSLFYVLTFILTNAYYLNPRRIVLYGAGLTAGLASVSKLTGLAAVLYLLFFAAYSKQKKGLEPSSHFLGAILIALLIPGLWFGSGFISQPFLFSKLLEVNASRSVLSGNFQDIFLVMFSSWKYLEDELAMTGLDPVLILPWLSIFYLFFKGEFRVVQLALVAFVVSSVILSYAWAFSTIPLYPFYGIAIGVLAYDLSKGLMRMLLKRS